MRRILPALAATVFAAAIAAWTEDAKSAPKTPASTPSDQADKQAGSAPSAENSPWVSIPGLKGQVFGIAVDRTTGDVYAVVRGGGIAKSTDQGKTFDKPTGGNMKGLLRFPCSLNVDPAGKRIACFFYHGEFFVTNDAGKSWAKSDSSLEYGAVDWEASGKTMLALTHDNGLTLRLSSDGGLKWTDLGKGFRDHGPIGAIDEKTLLAAKGKELHRSTDAGATWTKVADLPAGATGMVIYVFKGVAYLMTENGLFVSKDKGATWAAQGSPVKAPMGPFFGKDENHMLALHPSDGVYKTDDAGKTWKLIAPSAPVGTRDDFTYCWDPINNLMYAAGYNGKTAVMLDLNTVPAPNGK